MQQERQAYRRLGQAVIAQAWSDALTRRESDWREPGLFFELGGSLFRFWCGLADLDPEAVQQQFRRARQTVCPQQRRRRKQGKQSTEGE